MAIGMIAVVMMVSGLRVMWRRDRPVRTAVSPKKCVVIGCSLVVASSAVSTLPSSPTMARKTSSRVGCFSTYSTLAGGSSCLSSARVPLTMIRPSWRIAIRSASCSASSRYWVVSSTVVPLLGELLDGLPHLDARLRVEPGRRLVEEDDRRVPDQAHRDVEAAAHATRIGRHLPRGRVGQREPIEQVIGDRARVLEVPQPGDQHQVLPPAEDLVDGRELSGQADGLAHVGGLGGDVEAVDAGRPRVRLEQRGQDPHDRGLARPVRSRAGRRCCPGPRRSRRRAARAGPCTTSPDPARGSPDRPSVAPS